MRIGDLFPDPDRLPALYREKRGVWKYPFASVQQLRDDEGYRRWVIDLLAQPGTTIGEIQIEDVRPGDLVADDMLPDTPYWEVDEVELDLMRVYVRPIPPNPWETGVGAGGARITEHDLRVHTGEYERQRVDQVLDRIRNGEVFDYGDVAYVLEGTVPTQVGPNGSQGGWYNANDTSSNRGGRKGMAPEEIVAADAERLRQLGLPVPPGAFTGEIDPYDWTSLISSPAGSAERWVPGTLFPGEDPTDPAAAFRMIRTHPLRWVKRRNYRALVERAKPFPRAEVEMLWNSGDREGVDRLRKEWREGRLPGADWDVLDAAVEVVARVPIPEGAPYDLYYLLREDAIQEATERGRGELLELFEDAPDPTNRRYVAYGYAALELPDKLVRMFEVERDPEVVRAILEGLDRLGIDVLALMDESPEHQELLVDAPETPDALFSNYHRDELRKMLAEVQRRRERVQRNRGGTTGRPPAYAQIQRRLVPRPRILQPERLFTPVEETDEFPYNEDLVTETMRRLPLDEALRCAWVAVEAVLPRVYWVGAPYIRLLEETPPHLLRLWESFAHANYVEPEALELWTLVAQRFSRLSNFFVTTAEQAEAGGNDLRMQRASAAAYAARAAADFAHAVAIYERPVFPEDPGSIATTEDAVSGLLILTVLSATNSYVFEDVGYLANSPFEQIYHEDWREDLRFEFWSWWWARCRARLAFRRPGRLPTPDFS